MKLVSSSRRVFSISIILPVLTGQILLLNSSMHLSSAQEPPPELPSEPTIPGLPTIPEPSPEPTEELQKELELIWAKSEREGVAYSTCIIGQTLYVVGRTYTSVSNGGVFSLGTIEARDANTGELLDHWIDSEGISYLIDCAVVDNKLFAIEVYFETSTKRYYIKYLRVFDLA